MGAIEEDGGEGIGRGERFGPAVGEPQVTMVALDRLWGPDCAPTLIRATKLCVVRQTATSR
jgi:hypothetical protein